MGVSQLKQAVADLGSSLLTACRWRLLGVCFSGAGEAAPGTLLAVSAVIVSGVMMIRAYFLTGGHSSVSVVRTCLL